MTRNSAKSSRFHKEQPLSDYFAYIADWKSSKAKIFVVEGYTVFVSDVFETTKSSRYVDIESTKFSARVTVWESGELDVEAID